MEVTDATNRDRFGTLEEPGFGAGSKHQTAIANAEAGHSALSKFMVGHGIDINAIEGLSLGALKQKVGDPLQATMAAIFPVHKAKGEFRDSCLLLWIDEGGVAHEVTVFCHSNGGNHFICLVERDNPLWITSCNPTYFLELTLCCLYIKNYKLLPK